MPTDTVLASNPDQSGSGATRSLENINSTRYVAQVFALPPGTTKVTTAKLYVGKSPGGAGSADYPIELRRVDAQGKPVPGSSGVLDKTTLPVANLPVVQAGQFPTESTVTFSVNALDTAQTPKVAVAIAPTAFSPPGVVMAQTGGTQNPADTALSVSTSAGSTWGAPSTGKDLVFEVSGNTP